MRAAILTSTLTCPTCGHVQAFEMPTDACQYFLECRGCSVVLRPKAGDCCVFCSYGDVPCPPIQQGENCCKG
ncbi:GDCCVxC domain-containing (seleno)protein [uncultured Shimia sp.]|uniref:GDCCVxC domain-containing (seleno)protein n=1 Tax=uncultured Shimia sp. TaxID=573152 RepID=UPI002622C2AC|nr:GDCCVxC domain-containing (seleno)protein [uncultured Shimia sp.]